MAYPGAPVTNPVGSNGNDSKTEGFLNILGSLGGQQGAPAYPMPGQQGGFLGLAKPFQPPKDDSLQNAASIAKLAMLLV
jgi:hypothetical protein